MRVLVIEDERRLARYIKKGLEEHHFAVDLASDGEEGLFCAQVNEYDVIVLDLLLPKKDGLTVLRELRERNDQVPVLILTARDALTDKVAGFDAGADDYLTKPFSFEEYQEALGASIEEVSRLSRIVDNLFTLARADAGNQEFTWAPVDLSELLQEVYEQAELMAETKGLGVSLHTNGEVFVQGDCLRLK